MQVQGFKVNGITESNSNTQALELLCENFFTYYNVDEEDNQPTACHSNFRKKAKVCCS